MNETLFAEAKHSVKYRCKTARDHRGWEQHFVIDEHGTPIVRTASYRAGSETSQEAFLWLQEACWLRSETSTHDTHTDIAKRP